MDGVFINLTENDLVLRDGNGLDTFIVSGNPDLVTPTRRAIGKDSKVNGTFFQSGDEVKVTANVPMICEHIKYPFTQDQIDKINSFSQGRTRLLILDQKDVEYWSIGRFKCPFRNYRLFTWDNDKLIEYPIPKTYLDYVTDTVDSALNAGKKIYSKLGVLNDSSDSE